MITTIPPVGILIDLPFGVLMWTSIAHFLLILVMREDSDFHYFESFTRCQLSNPSVD